MPFLWDMTDEEIASMDEAAPPRGYMWGDPDQMRKERVRESVREAMRMKEQNVRRRPAARIVDASTGKVTMDPGGMERVHDAAQQGGLAAMVSEAGAGDDVVEAVAEIEATPGGRELLFTHVVEGAMKAQGIPPKDAKKVRLYAIGGSVGKHASANPYKSGDPRHSQWAKKYAHGGPNGDIPSSVMRKAKGGAAKAAEVTRQAGRNDDEMLVHMTPEEFNVLTTMWGQPDINPNTGMPEYGFLKKVWKGVKKAVKKVVKSPIFKAVAPIALSVFAPGIGTAVGMKLGLSGAAASIAGNAVVQGGLGALTGGKKGALTGAISGGLAGAAGEWGKSAGQALGLKGKTADVVGSALIRGGGGSLMGQDFVSGAIEGGLGAMQRGTMENFSRDARRTMGLRPAEETGIGRYIASNQPAEITSVAEEITPSGTLDASAEAVLSGDAPYDPTTGKFTPPAPAAPAGSSGGSGPRLSLGELASKYALPIGAGVVGAMGAASSGDEGGPPDWWNEQPGSFGDRLPVYTMNRVFRGLPNEGDYFTYGQAGAPQSGQHLFLQPEPFPLQPAPATGLGAVAQSMEPERRPEGATGRLRTGRTEFVAEGGSMDREAGHHVRGPGTGRSDDIPAMLSDGEYVIDAESVALLGDGSGDEGARRLDEMRRNLRKHKAKNLKKGEFTHKAKKPEGYMPKMRRLRRVASGGMI